MKAANRALFQSLEAFCAARGESIPSAGSARYIESNSRDKKYLKNSLIGPVQRFGQRKLLARIRLGQQDLVVLVGFEFENELPLLATVPNIGGVIVALLSEFKPLPVASPAEIRNIVEVGRMGDPDYSGHQASAVETLFPAIRMLKSKQALDDDSTWRFFLMLCLSECRRGESWIGDELADELLSLTDLNVTSLPYGEVCKSIFDQDPRSLFMALYRCIEATYAYESCRRLVQALTLDTEWQDLAAALEDEVGWHPQEAASLNVILKYALDSDLANLCKCLAIDAGNDVRVAAGRAIYALRNQVVHFRPGTTTFRVEDIEWNVLCKHLVGIVFAVFSHAYSPSS